MRLAVISDIHANLYALEAVLEEIDRDPPDEIWCLGDTVGYGPRPNECCELVRDRCTQTLVGNHDLVALGSAEVERRGLQPRGGGGVALDERGAVTRVARVPVLARSRRDARRLRALPRQSARPVWGYVLDELAVADSFTRTEAPVVLVGHSHVATAAVLSGETIEGGVAPADFSAASAPAVGC